MNSTTRYTPKANCLSGKHKAQQRQLGFEDAIRSRFASTGASKTQECLHRSAVLQMSRTRARGTGAVLMTAATLLASSLGQVVDPYGECARKVSNASFTTSLQNRCCVNRADCPSGTPLRCDSACANIWMPFASRCSMSLFASGIFPKLEAFSQKCEMTQYGKAIPAH